MAYKKSVKLKFESKKDFDQINAHLEKASIELSSFVTFCVSRVWSEILQEHQRQQQALLAQQEQEKEENAKASSDEPSSDNGDEQVSESSDSEKQEDGEAISAEAK